MADDMSARSQAEAHFKSARDAKTASASKQISDDRVKADREKSARLKAARLAKEEDVRERK